MTNRAETEMVERLARAIAAAGGSDWDSLPSAQGPGFGMRQMYTRMAIEALKALRDPTPAMVEAARRSVSGYPHPQTLHGIFVAMIDAALAPPIPTKESDK